MRKFHVNEKGEPGICKATIKCQFGEESQHYETAAAARAAFESSMNDVQVTSITKKVDNAQLVQVKKIKAGMEFEAEVIDKLNKLPEVEIAAFPDPPVNGGETKTDVYVRLKDGTELKISLKQADAGFWESHMKQSTVDSIVTNKEAFRESLERFNLERSKNELPETIGYEVSLANKPRAGSLDYELTDDEFTDMVTGRNMSEDKKNVSIPGYGIVENAGVANSYLSFKKGEVPEGKELLDSVKPIDEEFIKEHKESASFVMKRVTRRVNSKGVLTNESRELFSVVGNDGLFTPDSALPARKVLSDYPEINERVRDAALANAEKMIADGKISPENAEKIRSIVK